MRDNVWFTYKARIAAHERLERLNFHSQLLLVWYALLGVGLAIIIIKYPLFLGADTEIFSAFLSVALLILSLTISNRDFRGRAMQMRYNYLKLQDLYFETNSDGELFTKEQKDQYSNLLLKVENHKEIDDCIARVKTKGLTSRQSTGYEIKKALFWICFRNIFTIFLYIAPIFFLVVLL